MNGHSMTEGMTGYFYNIRTDEVSDGKLICYAQGHTFDMWVIQKEDGTHKAIPLHFVHSSKEEALAYVIKQAQADIEEHQYKIKRSEEIIKDRRKKLIHLNKLTRED